jgi:hypothetical protein
MRHFGGGINKGQWAKRKRNSGGVDSAFTETENPVIVDIIGETAWDT